MAGSVIRGVDGEVQREERARLGGYTQISRERGSRGETKECMGESRGREEMGERLGMGLCDGREEDRAMRKDGRIVCL